MPRLLNGHAVMGGGSGGAVGVSYDNELLLAGAATAAIASPCQVVCNAPIRQGSDVFVVTSVDPVTKVVAAGFPFPAPGADVVRAGAGVIIASLDQHMLRMRNLSGFAEFPGQQALDVDREFGISLSYSRQEGKNICSYFKDYKQGQPFGVTATGPLHNTGARVLRGHMAWSELGPNDWRARAVDLTRGGMEIPLVTRPGAIFQPLAIITPNSGEWLLYSDQDGYGWLQPATNPGQARQIPKNCFGLDAEFQPDGTLLVAWSTNSGEAPGTLLTQPFSI